MFSSTSVLQQEDASAFAGLLAALRSVDGVGAQECSDTIAALELLDPATLPEDHVLGAVVQVSTFKELRKMCIKEAKHRLGELTKSKTIIDCGLELAQIEDGAAVSATNMLDTLARAAAYAQTLSKPHADIDKYSQLIDRIITCVGSQCGFVDAAFGKLIQYASGKCLESVEQDQAAMHKCMAEIKGITHNVHQLHLEDAIFVHKQDCVSNFKLYQDSIAQRMDIAQDFMKLDDLVEKASLQEDFDYSGLAGIMAQYGNLSDRLQKLQVPCSAHTVAAMKGYRDGLTIDENAAEYYKERLKRMRQVILHHVAMLGTFAEDVENDVARKCGVQELVQMATWSSTPSFDKSCFAIIDECMALCSSGNVAMAKAAGKVAWKSIPLELSSCFKAIEAVVTPGSEITMPKLIFLMGDADVARICWQQCAKVGGVISPAVHKLQAFVSSGMNSAVETVSAGIFEDEDDEQFAQKFQMSAVETAVKSLTTFLSRTDLLRDQFGLEQNTTAAVEMRDKGRAAINRNALHMLLSRAHIAHATKGEALRKQLSAVWNAVVQHGLNDYIPSALTSKVKELLETPDVKAADSTQGEKIQEPRPSDALQSSGKRPRTT